MNCVQMTLHSAATFNFISFAVFFSIHFILIIHDRLSHFNHIKTYGLYAFFPDFHLYYIQWLWFLFELIYYFICCHLRCWKPLQLPHSLRFLCYLFFTKFLIFLELSQYIVCGERPQQREGFQWHILAPRKTRSDLGRRDPVKVPNLKIRDLRKWKWIVLAHNLNREKVRVQL